MTMRGIHIPGLIGGLLQQDHIEIFRRDLCDLAVSVADQGIGRTIDLSRG
jgi:hypothetical protein